jgi:hypothetical protein
MEELTTSIIRELRNPLESNFGNADSGNPWIQNRNTMSLATSQFIQKTTFQPGASRKKRNYDPWFTKPGNEPGPFRSKPTYHVIGSLVWEPIYTKSTKMANCLQYYS